MTRTLLNQTQTVGVQIEDDGTVTLATRNHPGEMWSAPEDLTPTDDDLSEITKCELVEWAWAEIIPNGEIICTEDGKITEDEGNLALYLWETVDRAVTDFDREAEDIEFASDRAIAIRVAHAMDVLWNGPNQTNPTYFLLP